MVQKNNKILKALFIAFFTIFTVSLIALAVYLKDYFVSKNQQRYKSEQTSSAQLIDNPIDFASLKEINPEIYAWISVPNTNIDYPVAQSATDDSFYLHHDIYGKYKFSGTIYTEMQNKKDFSDPNTVLYGHNMTKGYMFQNLFKFQDKNFFNKNRYFYIYTPDEVRTYTIFSAYQYDDRHILNSFDFSDEQVFAEYLESAKNPTFMIKNVRDGVNLTVKDKIVTLSTCLGNGRVYRYLVQGVLTDVEKTK